MQYIRAKNLRGMNLVSNELNGNPEQAFFAENVWRRKEEAGFYKRPKFFDDTAMRELAIEESQLALLFARGAKSFINRIIALEAEVFQEQGIFWYSEGFGVVPDARGGLVVVTLDFNQSKIYEYKRIQGTENGLYAFPRNETVYSLSAREVLFWAGADGFYKWDGIMACKASLPRPVDLGATNVVGSGSGAIRRYTFFFTRVDHQFNVIHSDFRQINSNLTTNVRVSSQLDWFNAIDNDRSVLGFDNKFAKKDPLADVINQELLDNGELGFKIPITATNAVKGDYLTVWQKDPDFPQNTNSPFYKLKVYKVEGGFLEVLKEGSFFAFFVGNGYIFSALDTNILSLLNMLDTFSNTLLTVYSGIASTTDNFFMGSTPIDYTGTTEVFVPANFEANVNYDGVPPFLFNFTGYTEQLTDFYDTLVQKSNVGAVVNLPLSIDLFKFCVYNDVFIFATSDIIFFSNTFVIGSSLEDFDPTNIIIVGETEDGPIKALFANEDYIVVCRERETYLVTGNVVTGNYRVQAFYQTRIGAVNQASMTKLFGQACFVSPRGIHLSSGGSQLKELSAPISRLFVEKNFLPYDISKPVSAVDFIRQFYFLAFYDNPNLNNRRMKMLVFDYSRLDWTLWDFSNIKGEGVGRLCGVEVIFDRLWIFDTYRFLEEQKNTFLDLSDQYDTGIATPVNNIVATPIPCFWGSQAIDGGATNLEKTLHEVLPYSMGVATDNDMRIQAFENFGQAPYSDVIVRLDANNRYFIKKRMNPTKAFSFGLLFSSGSSEDFCIKGYDAGITVAQDVNRRSIL